MTYLDVYVFNAMYKAYNQGWIDGAEGNPGTDGFTELLKEDLFCPEYVAISQEPVLSDPESIPIEDEADPVEADPVEDPELIEEAGEERCEDDD